MPFLLAATLSGFGKSEGRFGKYVCSESGTTINFKSKNTYGSLELITVIIVFILFSVISILITRLPGAWMLRINEVISVLNEIKHILKQKNNG